MREFDDRGFDLAGRSFGRARHEAESDLVDGLPRDPFDIAHDRLAAPSALLPLGADASGRDLLTRVAHGTLSTMVPALAVVILAADGRARGRPRRGGARRSPLPLARRLGSPFGTSCRGSCRP